MKAIYQGERIAEIPEARGFSSRNVYLNGDISNLKQGDEFEPEIKIIDGREFYSVKADEKGLNDNDTGNAKTGESSTESAEQAA